MKLTREEFHKAERWLHGIKRIPQQLEALESQIKKLEGLLAETDDNHKAMIKRRLIGLKLEKAVLESRMDGLEDILNGCVDMWQNDKCRKMYAAKYAVFGDNVKMQDLVEPMGCCKRSVFIYRDRLVESVASYLSGGGL